MSSFLLLKSHFEIIVEAAALVLLVSLVLHRSPREEPVGFGLTVDGLRVEGQRRIQRQAVHGDLTALDAVPVVPQRSRAVKLVVEAGPGAVVHADQDVVQSPLGRVFPCRRTDGRKQSQSKGDKHGEHVFLNETSHTNLAAAATSGTPCRRSWLQTAARW